ncbi:hypothetical protein Niako_5821 [Niastella koreensis GR20-10]|uniref:Uncharacterized protein n=1 Tax=Niastella koreensis (strain DSM 17620 / KACC 11465 / NBRC 106392 / GR20-10) TaxID=700598 RepID=G8TNW7_NIAKG|nr:hypothetical protein Niako_5821 [Niastella koreensis GR20-10]
MSANIETKIVLTYDLNHMIIYAKPIKAILSVVNVTSIKKPYLMHLFNRDQFT